MHRPFLNVAFDLDGTLIDSAPSILSCFVATLESHGIEPVLAMSEALIGPPLRDTLRRLAGTDDPRLLNSLSDTFKRHYDDTGYRQTKVFPGVDKMLHDLAAEGFSLYIATNKRHHPTRLILNHLGWADMFRNVYALDSRVPPFVGKREMLSALLADACIPVTSIVYVGDRSEDFAAANGNGMAFVAAAWGYRDDQLLSETTVVAAREAIEVRQLLQSAMYLDFAPKLGATFVDEVGK